MFLLNKFPRLYGAPIYGAAQAVDAAGDSPGKVNFSIR